MKRRMTALIITLCMVLTMMPLHAHATEAEHTCEWSDWTSLGNSTHYRKCTIDGCSESQREACSGGTATCKYQATCGVCGIYYGDKNPDNHQFPNGYGSKIDDSYHSIVCSCGHVFVSSEEHDFGLWYDEDDGMQYRICAVCYYTQTRTVHTHSYDSYAHDSNGHWKVCSCGATTTKEEHGWYVYKRDADKHYWRCNCGNNGWGDTHTDDNNDDTCDVCGYVMEHVHSYTAVVTAPTCNDRGYTTYTCSCNDSYVSDYKSELEHDWSDYFSIGDGRHRRICKNDNSHAQKEDCGGSATCHELAVCPDCGASHGFYEPHEWISVNGDAHTVECVVCKMKYEAEHVYIYWKNDGTNHWLVCGCGQGLNGSVEKHTFGSELKSDGDGHWKVCTACGYAAKKEAHTMTLKQSQGKYWYHLYVCEDCGYEGNEPCTMTYVGSADGHEYVCSVCGKKSDAGVRPHSDENGDKKCDLCGEAYHVHQYTYQANPFDETKHNGVCACRSFISATHADHDGDLKCDDCGQAMPTTIAQDTVKVEFVPGDGVTLPEDTEIVVENHTVTAEQLDGILNTASTHETVVLDDENIEVGKPVTFTCNGKTYKINEIITIDGTEYLIFGGSEYSMELISLTDKKRCALQLHTGNLTVYQGKVRCEVPTNRTLSINGTTYDVKCIYDTSASNDDDREQWALYYDGEPVGSYFPNLGRADFYGEYDPATLAGKQDESDLGTFTTGENPAAGLNANTSYDVTAVGAQDISLTGATNVSGTLTQTFDVPVQFVGNSNVTFVAVHDPNPYAAELAAAKKALDEAIEAVFNSTAEDRYASGMTLSQASWEYNVVLEKYNDWEEQYSLEHGIVTLSEDGLTLTATYAVDSFSPFIVYAFTEAELPEIKEFITQEDGTLVRVINGQPVITHTVASGENLTDIARMYGCTVDEIVALNSDLIENPPVISVGWVLTIPK